MASEFSKDNQQTDNPFVDKLLKNLKILAYNCIIKDENAADKAETPESLKNAELYMACIENRVALALFEYIPDQFLRRAGLNDQIINLYHVYHENVDVIPKDDDESHYRHRLVSMLRPWFISNYEEKNEYYRMITGKPALNDWGIPVRDYEKYLPSDFTYTGEFVHEIGVEACRELDNHGVLDIMKNDYPQAKYLNYVTAGITSYEARKNLDFMILYTPTDADVNITDEFLKVYQERREYLLRNVYSSVMEIQSEHYHAAMQIYLLVMTMVDMLANVQSHIVKKDILDRRCIEYIFSMYGVPYYRTIPYKFQKRICMNLHNLIKYKSCTEGLEQIAKMFDLDDVEFFKYYIVKERLTNAYGELLYSGKSYMNSKYNDIIELDTVEDDLTTESIQPPAPEGISAYNSIGDMSNIDYCRYIENPISGPTGSDQSYIERFIHWPFDYFTQKGNKVLVSLGDKLLTEETDYIISGYNVLRLYNSAREGNNSNILKYYFYYDKNTKDANFTSDADHSIQMDIVTSSKHKNNIVKIDQIKFPYNYFKTNNAILIFVDGLLITKDEFTFEGNTIIIDDNYDITDSTVNVVMLYSSDMDIDWTEEIISAYQNNQTTFTLKEPFETYIANGNSFLIFLNDKIVSPSRYSIDVSNSSITFTDGTTLDPEDDIINVVYIFSKGSIISSMELKVEDHEITIEKAYQTTFDFDMPMKDYVERQFKVFVSVYGTWLPSISYTYTNHQIVILDESLALKKGNKVKVKLVYMRKSNEDATNVKVNEYSVVAEEDRQSSFAIEAPIEHFFEKGSILIVNAQGQYLTPDKYEVDLDAGTLEITDYTKYLYKNQRLEYTFIYFDETARKINIAMQQVPDTNINSNSLITLNYPFFPYLETKQSFIVFYDDKIIPSDRIQMEDSFSFKINNFVKADQNKNIDIVFIYSNWYESYINQGFVADKVTVDVDDSYILIPEPAQNYIENNWPYIVTYNDNRILPETKYDTINTEFNTHPLTDLENGIYGDKISFVFIYPTNKLDYIWPENLEHSEDNTKLVFCKIPVKDLNSSQYMLDKDRYKDYDMTVAKDGWWTGKNYKANNYELIKKEIYEMPINYSRTKYYGLGRVIEFSSHTAKMAFFYSELFDDVFLEDELNIYINSLSEIHKFNIAHLILYMTCLTYIYNEQEDIIIETPVDGKIVTGFNFRTSLEEIRKMILDAHFMPEDFPIWTFIIPTEQIPSFEEFVRIHMTNEEVYHIIRNRMVIAEDYREYKIWKDIYDKLMTWGYNTEYYRLKNGKIATTFTEFLEEKDKTLYASIQYIKNIADEEEKIDTITNIIDDICYILEDHITKNLSRFVFSDFVGHSTSSILNYMMNIINFFKSYKIVFSERGEVINVGGNGVRRLNEDSVIKYYDKMTVREYFGTKDYIGLTENININQSNTVTENEELNAQGNHWIKEDCQITTYINGEKEEVINA